MLVLPVYDLLLLPGVTFYFKKDILDRMQVEKVEKGEEILFLIQKSEKRREDLTVDDFQNKGLVGTVENIDDDGNLSVYTIAWKFPMWNCRTVSLWQMQPSALNAQIFRRRKKKQFIKRQRTVWYSLSTVFRGASGHGLSYSTGIR